MTSTSNTKLLTRMAKHSSVYAVGTILRQLAGFLMLPIYTRLLTPADYGVIGMATFAIAILEVFFGARLIQAVPKYYFQFDTMKKKNSVIFSALLLTSTISLLPLLGVVVYQVPLTNILLGDSEYSAIIALFAVLLVTQPIENYGMGFIRIQQKPFLFVGISLLKLICQLSLNIFFVVYLKLGVFGVAYASIISSLVFAGALAVYTCLKTGLNFDFSIAKKMIIFCWPLWVGSLAALYIGSANRQYIRTFSTLEDVGLFELAARFASLLTVLFWQPFSQYWNTERFNLQKRGDLNVFEPVSLLVVPLLMCAALGITIFSQTVIEIMAGPAFHPAHNAVPWLTAAAFFACLNTYNNFGFLLAEKTKHISRIQYFSAFVATICFFTLIPAYGFIGAALAAAITNAVQLLITFRLATPYFNMKINKSLLLAQLIIAAATYNLTEHYTHESLAFSSLFKIMIYGVGVVAIFSVSLAYKPAREHGLFITQVLLSRIKIKKS